MKSPFPPALLWAQEPPNEETSAALVNGLKIGSGPESTASSYAAQQYLVEETVRQMKYLYSCMEFFQSLATRETRAGKAKCTEHRAFESSTSSYEIVLGY
jgi:hypothetical protein